ncbi:Phox-like protein [Cutaneotrichosporon oleaginosum]|uniref:Endosomal/vacuolar adapter protein YPT35 n=1 Tax=Cutaneotrichosporon oleaginosum TaxID=879819 RepID=A0A0J0XM05_9TREE|nr:Phox-like protein [Cutaneotrichosporon oleaginosum]KLT42093.1 Phox-like protein [Cutaneotrichosporon oleaginosum]TXT04668.1 hypothetical protein COLE_07487 [Cutaneotrichosporon oleaginosum]
MTTPSTQPWRDPLPSSSSPRPRRLSSTPPLPGPSTSESTPKKPALVLLASSPSPTPSLSPLYSPSDESFAPSRPESPASPAFITTLEDVPDPRPSALLAPVRGLRALARVCAGGGAVAYAAARRRRRLDGDPDVDGDLGGSRGRDTAGWRSARPAEEGHTVQVLVGGRVSPALSYGSRPSGEWRPSMEERVSFERSSMDGREWMEERRPSFVEESVEGSVEGYTVDGSEASATPSTSVMSSSPAAIQEGQSGFRWPWSAASSSLEEGERPAPFAAEVAIKGWQVVGGKSWDDSAKVGAYVVYDIEIALRNGTTLSITRRYTEFVRLRDTLRRAYPHLRRTIPALPGKNHMHKFSPEFLEERRPRLQRFLRTVALHPEMGQGNGVLSQWVLGGPSGPPAPRNSARLGLTLPSLPGLGRHEPT